jgi:hypothetical protein
MLYYFLICPFIALFTFPCHLLLYLHFLVIYRFIYISSHLLLYLHFIRTCEYLL